MNVTVGTLTAIFEMVNKVSATSAQIARDVKRDASDVENSAKKAGGGFGQFAGQVAMAGKVLGGAAVFATVAKGISNIVDAAGELDEVSGRISDTAESVQRLQAVGVSFDTEMGAIVAGVQELTLRLGQGEIDQEIAKIGLSVDDLLAMSPAERFIAVAEALGQIEDPAQRAAAAKEILTRTSKQLANVLDKDVRGAMDGVITMSNETVKGIDMVSTAWGRAKISATGFAGELIANIGLLRSYNDLARKYDEYFGDVQAPTVKPTALPQAASSIDIDWQKFDDLNDTLTEGAEKAITINKEFQQAAEETKRIRDAWTGATIIKDTTQLVSMVTELGGATRLTETEKQKLNAQLEQALTKYRALGQEAPSALRDMYDETKRLTDVSFFNFGDTGFMGFVPAAQSAQEEAKKVGESIYNLPSDDTFLEDMWDPFKKGIDDSSERIQEVRDRVVPSFEDTLGGTLDRLGTGFADLAQVSGGSLDGVLGDIAQFIALARVASEAGSSISAGASQMGEGGWQNMMGGAGTMATGIISGYGAMQSATSGPTRGGNIGRGAATGAAIGTKILPGWGTAIGAGVGAIWGAVKATEEEKVNDMRDEIEAAAGGLHELNAAFQEVGLTLDNWYDAKTFDDLQAAMNALQQAQQQQAEDAQNATAYMEEFGISIEKAGQAFQQSQMDQQAGSMIDKIRAMLNAGVDVTAIMEGAGDEVGSLIIRYMELGLTVPKELEVIAKKMFEQGTLVDATGQKLEDWESIPFAESLNEKLDSVFDKLLVVLERIGGFSDVSKSGFGDATDAAGEFQTTVNQVGVAMQRLPKRIDIEINGELNMPEGIDVPQLGDGGIVRRPTMAMLAEGGRAEAVIPLPDRTGLLGQSHVTVNIDARDSWFDDYRSLNKLSQVVSRAVQNQLESQGHRSVFPGSS